MAKQNSPEWTYPVAGFRSRKAAQICVYFATKSKGTKKRGTIAKLKLIKLIYLAERRFLSEHHHPMLFDELYSLPHGPICSNTLNGINGRIHDELWTDFITRSGNIVVAMKKLDRADLDEISDAEMEVLSSIWDDFGKLTPSQLRNYTHKHCSEYTETEKSSIPISYEQIFEALGEKDARGIAREILDMVEFEGMLAPQ